IQLGTSVSNCSADVCIVHVRDEAAGKDGGPRPTQVKAGPAHTAEANGRKVPLKHALRVVFSSDFVQLHSRKAVVFAVSLFRTMIHPVVSVSPKVKIGERRQPISESRPYRTPHPN